MSHNIQERDNLFTVREAAWHGLGEVLTDYPTREQAQAIAHPWEPVSRPLYRVEPYVDAFGDPQTQLEEIDGWVSMERSDTGDMLGVVTDTYTPVSNNDMYDIAEALEAGSPDSVRYETGGSLKNGAKVWLLIRLNEPLTVMGDPNGATIPYYALQNAHDGLGSFRGQSIMTRIVCDNTSHVADLEAEERGTEFVFRHTSGVAERIEQAKAALAGWRDSIAKWQRFSEHMMGVTVTPAQRQLFVEEFIPMPNVNLISPRVQNNVETGRRELRQILTSETCEDINHTAYGLIQGAIEYSEHERRALNKESRFKRAYLDRSRLALDAVNLAQDVSLA